MGTDTENTSSLKEPLRFKRIFLEKPWGGRTLEKFGVSLPEGLAVGESWEIADRDEHNSEVEGGSFEGRRLRGLMLSEREALLGDAATCAQGNFPLIVKYITASQPLSVQVHPDHEAAKRLNAVDGGKTECWYVLDAEPGSVIHLGIRPEIDSTTFVKEVSGDGVVDLLQTWEVQPGQFIFVPAGTVHSIGAGVTLVEIQENSDLTFRMHDWGRVGIDGQPRELHLDESLLSIDYERPVQGPQFPNFEDYGGASKRARLADCDSFSIELLDVAGEVDLDTERRPLIYVVTKGAGQITTEAGGEWCLEQGASWLLPASFGKHRIEPKGAELRLLIAAAKA